MRPRRTTHPLGLGGLLLGAWLSLAAGPGCGDPPKRKPVDPAAALGRLRQDLWRLDFRSVSADALDRTVALARRTRGPAAAVVWSQVATSRLDWAMLILKEQRPGQLKQLLTRLLTHLGLPKTCLGLGLKSGTLAAHCRAPVARAIADGFERAARIHEQEGDIKEAGLARRRAQLVHLALLHQALASPEADQALRKALNDPAYDIQRTAQLLFVMQWHRQWHRQSLANLDGPLTGPQRLARAVPHPCPRAFRLLGRAPLAAVDQALRRCNCHTGCKLRSLGRCKTVATPISPLTPDLVTIRAAVVVQSLRLLAGVARRLRPGQYRGLQRKFRGQLERFRTEVRSLRVRVPYPPALRVGSVTVSPPAESSTLPDAWEAHATIHVLVAGDRVFVGLAPSVGTGESRPVLLDRAAGYPFPGKQLMISGSHLRLRQALGAARPKTARRGQGVALYLDRTTPVVQVAAWVRRLHLAGAGPVELLFGDGYAVARSLRATWDKGGGDKGGVAKPGKPVKLGQHWSTRRLRATQTYGAWMTVALSKARVRAPNRPPQVRFVP